MGKLLGRFLRILAWLAPSSKLRAALHRKCGVKMGRIKFIGTNVNIDSEYPHLVLISDNVSIAANVTIAAHGAGSHYHRNHSQRATVQIGEGAWIGTGAIILPGVTIGRGAIVGAGSVVSREVPDFAIAAGNPARVVGKVER